MTQNPRAFLNHQHLHTGRYYSCGALLVWLCDKLSRSVAAAECFAPQALQYHPRNDATMLKLSHTGGRCAQYQPGQYFFINIPAISLSEWHPFTASAVLDDGIVFYIKKVCPKTIPYGVFQFIYVILHHLHYVTWPCF